MMRGLVDGATSVVIIGWLAMVGVAALSLIAGWASHPAWQRLITVPVLVGGVGLLLALVAGLWLLWRRWPARYLPVIGTLVALVCGGLTLTSGQGAAVATAAGIGLLAALLGMTLLDRLGVRLAPLALLAVGVALGLGCLALAGLALGLVGALSQAVVLGGGVAVALGLAVWSRPAIGGWLAAMRAAWPSPPSAWAALVAPLLAGAAVLAWVGALAPETMYDALMYHLALARIYAEQQQVRGLDYSMFSYWPLGGELLFALGYLLGGETAAKLLQLLAGGVTVALVGVIGREVGNRATGLVAAAIVATIPVVTWEATTAYVDLLWTMHTTAALSLLLVWLRAPDGRALPALVGACLGFALGIKLTAAFFALGVGLVMLGVAWQRRTWGAGGLVAPLLTTATTLLVALPWYLRAYLLTGNPVYPFLNRVFQSPLWPPTDEWLSFASYGMGTDPGALAALPWRLTFETKRFGEVDGAAGIVLLACVPLALLTWRGVVRRPATLLALCVVCGVFALGWVVTSQQLRYLLPALAGLAVVAAVGLVGARRRLQARAPRLAWLPTTMLVGAGLLALPTAAAPYLVSQERLPIGVVLGRVGRADYLRQIFPMTAVVARATATDGRQVRIFPVGETAQYLSDAPLVLPFFSAAGNRILRAASAETLRAELAATSITHILINRQTLPAAWRFLVHSATFLDQHAVLEAAERGIELYRLR